jgi:hypothetical protein
LLLLLKFIGLCVFILYFCHCFPRDTLGHLQNFLKFFIVEFTHFIILLYLPSSIPGKVSTVLIFSLTYMYRVVPLFSPSDLLYLHPPHSHQDPPMDLVLPSQMDICFSSIKWNQDNIYCLTKIVSSSAYPSSINGET